MPCLYIICKWCGKILSYEWKISYPPPFWNCWSNTQRIGVKCWYFKYERRRMVSGKSIQVMNVFDILTVLSMLYFPPKVLFILNYALGSKSLQWTSNDQQISVELHESSFGNLSRFGGIHKKEIKWEKWGKPKKSNLHYSIPLSTPKLETSGGAHLCCLSPGLQSSQEKWCSDCKTLAALCPIWVGRNSKPQISCTDSIFLTTELTGRSKNEVNWR